MKKKYHTEETIPNSNKINRKIRSKFDSANTHIYDLPLF